LVPFFHVGLFFSLSRISFWRFPPCFSCPLFYLFWRQETLFGHFSSAFVPLLRSLAFSEGAFLFFPCLVLSRRTAFFFSFFFFLFDFAVCEKAVPPLGLSWTNLPRVSSCFRYSEVFSVLFSLLIPAPPGPPPPICWRQLLWLVKASFLFCNPSNFFFQPYFSPFFFSLPPEEDPPFGVAFFSCPVFFLL